MTPAFLPMLRPCLLCLLILLLAPWGCGNSPGPQTAGSDSGFESLTSETDTTTQEPASPDTQAGSATEVSSDVRTTDGTDDTVTATEEPCVPRPRARWTLMLYEDADNNLEDVLLDDVNEAEAAAIPDDINIIVLLDRAAGYDKRDGNWKGARLYRLAQDEDLQNIHSERLGDPVYLGLTSTSDDGEELNMGSSDTLKAFIDFSRECFPAEHTILHLSDHGDGWRSLNNGSKAPAPVRGICHDDSSGKLLSVSEDLPAALAGQHFDAITFDACIMGTVEVAWALAPFADYFGASVMNVPDTGFDYTITLNGWFEDPTAERWVDRSVEAFHEYYEDQGSVGFTAVDLRAMAAFGQALDALLSQAQDLSAVDFRPLRNQAYRPDPLQMAMRDTRNLLGRFAGHVPEATLQAALDAFDATILSKWYSSNVEKIEGLSIYAPGAGILQGGPYQQAYDNTPFAKGSLWDDFIKARLTIPAATDTDTNNDTESSASTEPADTDPGEA